MRLKGIVLVVALGALCCGAMAFAGSGGKVKKTEMVFKGVQTSPNSVSGRFRYKGNQSGKEWKQSCMYRGHKLVLKKVTKSSKTRIANGQSSGTGFFNFGKLDPGKYQIVGPKAKVKNGYGSGYVICKKAKSEAYRLK